MKAIVRKAVARWVLLREAEGLVALEQYRSCRL